MNLPDLSTRQQMTLIGVAAFLIITVPDLIYMWHGESGLQSTSISISGLLTLALVVLYFQQYSTQSKQTDLMEDQQSVQKRQTSIMEDQQSIWERQAEIMDQQRSIQETQNELMERRLDSSVARVGEITADGDKIHLSLKNSGRGAVKLMYLRSEIIGDTGSVEVEPGYSQLTAVEGDSSLPPFSPPKEYKARVEIGQTGLDGRVKGYPFKKISGDLSEAQMEEDIGELKVRFTLEINDENTRPEDFETVKEFELGEQEIRVPEEERHKRDGDDLVVPQSQTFSESIKLVITPGATNILPEDTDLLQSS
ncbi:hypothetical protein QA600_08555 [Natronococcus sp. A-GB1]|uniref:hypothetical protein n=1 Tax=Natronococcus sp. A-GB1 TaxID=3037648 RepID=UPI00241E119A|nr:hypothetical protein [Natronococcus sp. A-GB1]MDG5759391.1 hypothetical protein [Natronococcus sp. A-GB1]